MSKKRLEDMDLQMRVYKKAFEDSLEREHALRERLEFQKRLTRRAIRKSRGWRPWSK